MPCTSEKYKTDYLFKKENNSNPIVFIHGVGLLYGLSTLLLGHAPVQQHTEPWPGAGRLRSWPVE